MKIRYPYFWGVLALLVLLFGGCAQHANDLPKSAFVQEPASGAAENGTTETDAAESAPSAPIEFECVDLDGNTVTEEVFSRSGLTMVNVWATYCGPCLGEMPQLGELAAEYDAEEFQIIGIISDVPEGEDPSVAKDLVQQTGASYPHLLLNRSVYTALLTEVVAVPTTFFIDENGEIVDTVLGAMEKEAWKEKIDALLEQ